MGVHDVAVFVFGVIDVGVRAVNIALGVVGQVGDVLDLVGVQLFVELQAADLEKLVFVAQPVLLSVMVMVAICLPSVNLVMVNTSKCSLMCVCGSLVSILSLTNRSKSTGRITFSLSFVSIWSKRKAAAERPSSGPYRATLLARSVRAARKSSSFARRSLLSKMESTISRMV